MANETASGAGGATDDPQVEQDRRLIVDARKKGRLATLGAYFKLSGPGWLQSAITLGGGSLSSSLYLGVLGGFALLWLQPVAMIIGVIMLSAIAYVALSTGEKPFRAINQHVNPVLGWGWLIATLMANCVWSLPQFALVCKAFRQNLMPGVFADVPANTANGIIAPAIAVLCLIMVYFYDTRGLGFRIFNLIIKFMVAVIVVSFFGVVIYMSIKGVLPWGKIGSGLIPNIRLLWSPADTFTPFLDAVTPKFRQFWSDMIVHDQQDVLVAAAATAVGINMTFLLPYSMLKRGWNRDFRGLAVFDLGTGLFIPFILATGCVVIAASQQFHTKSAVCFPKEGTVSAVFDETEGAAFAAMARDKQAEHLEAFLAERYEGTEEEQTIAGRRVQEAAAAAIVSELAKADYAKLTDRQKRNRLCDLLLGADKGAVKAYRGNALRRVKEELKDKGLKAKLDEAKEAAKEQGVKAPAAVKAAEDRLIEDLPLADRRMAGMLVHRDNIHLARALKPLTGKFLAQYVFGIGVIGMAISSIIILMLINGFCVTEILGTESKGLWYRLGCVLPAVGLLGPFIWSGAAPYLAMPTSVFGFILIPIAYTTFALVLNSRSLLGENMPRGLKRWVWNLVMFLGVAIVLIGSVYKAYDKTKGSFLKSGWFGIGGIVAFVALALIVHFVRKKPHQQGAGE